MTNTNTKYKYKIQIQIQIQIKKIVFEFVFVFVCGMQLALHSDRSKRLVTGLSEGKQTGLFESSLEL